MNRWAWIVWSIAAAATAGWIAAGALGYRVRDQESLALHTLASFAALLALFLAHAWVVVFALVSRRLVTRAAGERSAALARAVRLLVAAGALALAAAGAQFAVSNVRFPARLRAPAHARAALGSAAALALALAVEFSALAAHRRAVAALER